MSPDGQFGTELAAASDCAVVDSLLGAPSIGVVVVDPEGGVEYVDEAAERYFGVAAGDSVGGEAASFVESAIRPALERPDSFPESRDLHVLPGADREERWLRYTRTPIESGEFAGGHLEQFADVTAEQTRDRLEQYRSIVETTDAGVVVVDADWRIEYANPVVVSRLDHSLAAMAGRPVVSLVEEYLAPDGSTDGLEAALEAVFAGGDDQPAVELPLEMPTGHEKYSFTCKAGAEGTNAVITARNVSESRRRDRRYETLVENFPNGAVTLVDDTLEYQLAGGKLFEDIGETPADVEGSSVDDVRFGDRDVFVDSYRSALDGETVTTETRAGGRTYLLRTLPVADDDGTVRAAIGMTQDITERKERAEELRWKSRALDEAPVGVAITDPQQPDNSIIYANQQFADLSGYGFEEILGRNCRFLQGEETDPETVTRIRDAIDDTRSVSVEIRNYRADGTEFWNQLDIAPVRDDTGAVANYVGFQQDVTERKERQRELREVNELLDVALTETGTGVWILAHDEDRISSFGTTTELFGLDPGDHTLDSYLDRVHPADRPAVEEALETARESRQRFDVEFRVDGGSRWVHSRGTVSEDHDTRPRIVGVVTDITDRKRRVRALEKRERILNELHTATREFYPPESLTEIGDFLVEFTEGAFDVDYVSVKQYDEETGNLEPAARSVSEPAFESELGSVSPGSNPIWDAYRTGETGLFSRGEADGVVDGIGADATQLLVAPVGDFGVVTAITTARQGFDDVDVELVEVLTANASSAFQRLRTDRVHTAIAEELSDQQSRIAELNDIIDSVQAVQRRLADSESREALETGVCEELVAMDRVDFAWLGRPTGEDTDLSAAAWAGDADGYLDSVLSDSSGSLLPAHRVAADHEMHTLGSITGRVFDEPWAKDAVSYGLNSVLSVPLVYDGVLYGTLTVYSRREEAFDTVYENLFADIASLMVNYSRVLDQRQAGSQRMHTELEFELTDSAFPLQQLAAATESRLRFDTVAERTADHVRILVTVEKGDATAVLEHAGSMTRVDAAEWFGDTEHSQLSLRVRTPFLESLVSKHGGKLREAVSGPSRTTFRVEIPSNVSQRPIFDSLTSRYQEIELTAKRRGHRQSVPDTREAADLLTDRQYEILNAAFHGGYYETPRRVKGEDLAESFDISGPAVYNHLQAAHRTLLETVFESTDENTD